MRERSTVVLTHYGRKSGRPYKVTIWYVRLDGDVWIGSLRADRNWVKNVAATGRADVDFGDGPVAYRAEWTEDPDLRERFRVAVQAKYPIFSRLIRLFVANPAQIACRLRPAQD